MQNKLPIIALSLLLLVSLSCSALQPKVAAQPTAAPAASPAVTEPPVDHITAIAAGGYHMCQLTASGKVSCWGDNSSMQLGDGTYVDSSTPVAVQGLEADIVAISAGDAHTCALTSAGGVKCWGDNSKGQLGNGTKLPYKGAAQVSGLGSGVTAISAGGMHSCAVLASGGARCWGQGGSGRLGDGKGPVWSTVPLDVVELPEELTAIAAGGEHTCALTSSGSALCWGKNDWGQLGTGQEMTLARQPVEVAGLSGAIALDTGWVGSCALTENADVLCWGLNDLVTGFVANVPQPVDGAVNVTAISMGFLHACALTADNQVLCWGSNEYGQLGGSREAASLEAVRVDGLDGSLLSISAGGNYTCALSDDDRIQCWGSNIPGQIDNSSTTWEPFLPVVLAGLQ